MEISVAILLIPYALGVLLYAVFAFFALMHVIRHGLIDLPGFIMTFLFLAATVLILFITYSIAIQFDWGEYLYIQLTA